MYQAVTGMSETLNSNWSLDGDDFKILINDEDQHSIWPSAQPVPAGWSEVGPVGSKEVCLDWIKTNWTDISPKSVRTLLN
jgi:MbtH protein